MKKPAKKAEDTTTYILELTNGGMRKVTVPSHWKVTFGPIWTPKGKGISYGDSNLRYALRFYESANQQRAIFTDVASFRDEKLPVLEKVVKTQTKIVSRRTDQGEKNVEVEARVAEWLDPMNPGDGGVNPFATDVKDKLLE